jgi:hypothetical protein
MLARGSAGGACACRRFQFFDQLCGSAQVALLHFLLNTLAVLRSAVDTGGFGHAKPDMRPHKVAGTAMSEAMHETKVQPGTGMALIRRLGVPAQRLDKILLHSLPAIVAQRHSKLCFCITGLRCHFIPVNCCCIVGLPFQCTAIQVAQQHLRPGVSLPRGALKPHSRLRQVCSYSRPFSQHLAQEELGAWMAFFRGAAKEG